MLTDVSGVRTASIIRAMIKAADTSETSVNIYLTTRQYSLEDSKLYTRNRENLKSHKIWVYFSFVCLFFRNRVRNAANHSLRNSCRPATYITEYTDVIRVGIFLIWTYEGLLTELLYGGVRTIRIQWSDGTKLHSATLVSNGDDSNYCV
jgi:hypothetical protein